MKLLSPVSAALDSKFHGLLYTLNQWYSALSGNLSFGDPDGSIKQDNIIGTYADVADTGLANTEFSITHGLNLIPAGYILISSSISCNVYQQKATGTAWTSTQIFLKCDQAHAAVRLFILGH